LVVPKFIFWICLTLVVYTYFLYPVLLFFLYSLSQVRRDWHYLLGRRNRRAPLPATEQLPAVTLIVPAHNEQVHLPDKIENLRQIPFPSGKGEIIFVSDGSTDGTNQILQKLCDSNVKTIFLPVRRGKANALNIGVSRASHDILIVSDASTLFATDAVKNLVRHFSDPTVGVVCGALQFVHTAESQQTEGFYWKYESMLRLMEARLGATLTASGAIFAFRREAYCPLAPGTIIEDFLVPLNARKRGYSVVYDPEAVATDFAAASVAGEFTRRVRLAVGSFRSLGELIALPLRGFTGAAFYSHKLLRWITPFLLIGMLASSCLLASHSVYRAVLVIQVFLYLWALMGFLFQHRLKRVRFGLLGYFWLAMNVAFLVGFWRFLFGHGDAAWQRVN
jgi:cellulose synthase/poly-beta-1,6-N-acetylglucosamine synthase-like glycosyltransferase